MNKEFKNIDDLFQAAFSDESASVPPIVKSNIDQRLGFQKKHKTWSSFIALIVLILLSTTVTLLLTQRHDTKLVQPTGTQNNHPEINEAPETRHHSGLGANPHDESQFSSSSADHHTADPPGHTTGSSDPKTEKVTTNKISSKGLNGQKGSVSAPTFISSSTESSTSSGSETGPMIMQMPNNPNAGDTRENQSGMSQTRTVRMLEQQEKINLVGITNSGYKCTSPTFNNNIIPQQDFNASPLERGEMYSPWMISGIAGVQLSNSKYTTSGTSDSELYENANTDKPGFEGNLDIRYSLKNSLTFGTGAAISQLQENYSYFKEQYTYDSTLIWTYNYIYDSLDTTIIIDVDSSYTTVYDSTLTTPIHNYGTTQATYLQIPFSIGTHIIRQKFQFDFYLMGRFNYLLKASGGYMQNDVFTTFSQSNQIFKTWYIDLILGAAIHYQLLDKLYLTGTFRYRPQLGNLYEGVNFNRSIRSYHLGVGLSWKL